MSLQYHFVLPPTGYADSGVVSEMFTDVKAYVDAFVPSGGAAPVDARYVTLATNATLTDERVLTGTTNQIVITDNGAGSTVVLSLPQSIATTSSPSFAGILYRNGSGNTVTVNPPSSFTNYTLTLPTDDGNTDQVLKTNGSGVLSWVDQTASGANAALSNLASVAINTALLPGSSASIDLGSASKFWRDILISRSVAMQENGGTNLILMQAPASLAAYTLVLPNSAGSPNQVLKTDGSGNTSWVDQTALTTRATTELDNLGTTAVNATIKAGTDNSVDLGSSSKTWKNIYTKSGLYLQETAAGTDAILVTAPSALSLGWTLTLPTTGGSPNYLLKTDGSGTTSWVSAGSLLTGATTALDNLASVAINASLVVDGAHDQTYNLGSTSLAWENVYAVNLIAGRSGVAGIVYVYPSTAAKGHLIFLKADNAGDTETTITVASQAAARTYTVIDAGGAADFVMTAGSQTLAGTKTFSSAIPITATSNHLVLSTASNTLTINANTQATSARTWSIPDVSGNGTFAALEGTQTFSGAKTFTAAGLLVSSSQSGTYSYVEIDNLSNTASSHALLELQVGGTSGGDAFAGFFVSGSTLWSLGLDNSDSDAFCLTNAGTLNGTNVIRIDSSTVVFNSSYDIYTVGLTDYSGTSTIVGWGSFTTKQLSYKKIGKLVHVWAYFEGTSNSATTTFTLPFNNNGIYVDQPITTYDAGVAGVGRLQMPNGGATVTMSKAIAGTAFSSSGNKVVQANFVYQA